MAGVSRLELGFFVLFAGSPGVGRIAEVSETDVLVEFFESPAEPSAGQVWMPASEVKHCRLGVQSRVFFRDEGGRWRAGRVVGGDPPTYAVRVPNSDYDLQVHESRLRIRWETPPNDPLQVLIAGGQESPLFRDARIPVRNLLLMERAASASATGIVSAGVQIHQHQVNGALRVLRDPVQRYLLADEVGMGKSIQAGYVARQVLLDDASARVVVLAPEALIGQWREDLREKFFLDDFALHSTVGPSRQRYVVRSHDDIKGIDPLERVDLLIVDEAHEIAAVDSPDEMPYPLLARLCGAAERLLLISATPSMQRDATHLALLHLLDPDTYRWEAFESFQSLLGIRRELAYAVYSLDVEPDPDNPELLQMQFDAIRQILPKDARYDQLASEALVRCESATTTDSDSVLHLARAVSAVRTHIAETYRLHHRVIRNRRHRVLDQRLDELGVLTPFEVTGRVRPKLAPLTSSVYQTASEVLFDWLARTSDLVLDQSLDADRYGAVLRVLLSRLGGPVEDLCSAFRCRLGHPGPLDSLTPRERAILAMAPTLAHERECLDRLLALDDVEAMQDLVKTIVQRAGRNKRTVVFAGPGTLAHQLVGAIRHQAPSTLVHEHSRHMGSEASDSSLADWRFKGGLLVTDDSGEVGRNLQEANAVVHVRLPDSPNILEQRLGRVDRYGNNPSATQYIVSSPDAEAIHRHWLRVLLDGYAAFDASTSALQEAVDQSEGSLWDDVIRNGVSAFDGHIPLIKEAMRLELRRVNELDELESIFEESRPGNDIALAISQFEVHAADSEGAYLSLLEGSEGFRFFGKRRLDGSVTFDKGQANPLLSPRLLQRLQVPEAGRTGYFDRWALRDHPGRRLFRRGNPFIDGVEELLQIDDRGQASALWRIVRSWDRDPTAFLGVDFLVEADLAPVLELVADRRDLRPVMRRRADTALPPFLRRIWIRVDRDSAEDDPRTLRLLDAAYDKSKGDVNLGAARSDALFSLFGDQDAFVRQMTISAITAREELSRVSDLRMTCASAKRLIESESAVLLAQAEARSQAGNLLVERHGIDLDRDLGFAIAQGVGDPDIRVLAVTCTVLANESWSAHGRG